MDDATYMLWRDKNSLVFDPNQSQFPNTCLKTNSSDDCFLTELKLLHESQPGSRAKVSVWLPLADKYGKKKTKIGVLMLLFGLTFFLTSCLLLAFQWISDSVGMPLMLGGVVLMPVSAITIFIVSIPPVRIKKMEGNLIWLAGVSPSYLEDLPPYSPETAESFYPNMRSASPEDARTPDNVKNETLWYHYVCVAMGIIAPILYAMYKAWKMGNLNN